MKKELKISNQSLRNILQYEKSREFYRLVKQNKYLTVEEQFNKVKENKNVRTSF